MKTKILVIAVMMMTSSCVAIKDPVIRSYYKGLKYYKCKEILREDIIYLTKCGRSPEWIRQYIVDTQKMTDCVKSKVDFEVRLIKKQ